MDDLVAKKVESVTRQRSQSIAYFASGNNTRLYRIKLADGEMLVAKYAEVASCLAVEGYMLDYLAKHSTLKVPYVVHADESLLLMEYMPDDGRLDHSVEMQAAEILASLHQISAKQFGLDRDTVIGPLHQPNTQEEDWINFFATHRLGYMAKKALEEDKITPSLMHDIDRLIAKLGHYIEPQSCPCLIHGDVWQGNVLCYNGKLTGFIDPAIYYADPEIELAFSTLFHTFSDRFYNHYSAINPIQPGFFETRRDLYNLYPLLVHVRLFGGGYVQQVQTIVKKFI